MTLADKLRSIPMEALKREVTAILSKFVEWEGRTSFYVAISPEKAQIGINDGGRKFVYKKILSEDGVCVDVEKVPVVIILVPMEYKGYKCDIEEWFSDEGFWTVEGLKGFDNDFVFKL